MYNLMRRAVADYDQVLVCFVDELHTPPQEILDLCVEVVQVRRGTSHMRPLTSRPDVVEEFDFPAFHEALRLTTRKWRPAIAQLEFTQMAQYSRACAPARTVLVEHDVTLDLYRQLLDRSEDWETRQQYERWVPFEQEAWRQVDAVVVMSEKDRRTIGSPKTVVLPNGVDLDHFRPAAGEPEPTRLLFIGSFGHLPNVLAIDWFVRQVLPLIGTPVTLHVIAGARHRYFLERYRDRVDPPINAPGILVDDFVADPRPAYQRAAIVVAPLLASAGTNIKIMEAMAMGKAIVSTRAGINGLDELRPGSDLEVAGTAEGMASAIEDLLRDPARRLAFERQARVTVERLYGWDAIALRQRDLYRSLAGTADGG
jgi:glycosyltransferase involved in cell wall biosynthesis